MGRRGGKNKHHASFLESATGYAGTWTWTRPEAPTPGWSNPQERGWAIGDLIAYDQLAWTTQAACVGTDPDLFFQRDTDRLRTKLLALCARCPVTEQCLEHAIAHREQGWWGGTSKDERRSREPKEE